MDSHVVCPTCGAALKNGLTCQDYFHQMLFWEQDDGLGQLHHLMVLSYNIQHPYVYSQKTLEMSILMLWDFLHGATIAQMRKQISSLADSSKRSWKITGTPESHGQFDRAIPWKIRAQEVVAGGKDNFLVNVQAWAESIWEVLEETYPKRWPRRV
jgi:Family of unknown function (DUF5946)